ncbi:hypothetical protein AB0G06_43515 [Nonomuraea dietziae]|uniref:hypothetical protein n=1 Tax=Nonomuraea dietziae TaxID=65515 RepID=UPI0033EE8A0A
MATKVITICDWHGDDTPSKYRNRWTNPQGKRRRNDLCADHQKEFLGLWERLEQGSALDTEDAPARPSRRKAGTKEDPSYQAIIKAWARSVGHEVQRSGRVPFHIEQEWKEAGRPNVLEGP